VDNGSADGTRGVVEACAEGASVPVSYLHEPRIGASVGRNAGAARGRYEYVAFLDDDAVASSGWLAEFDVVIRRFGALAVGGRVEPMLDDGVHPPPWFEDRDLRGLFGVDHGPGPDGGAIPIRWPLYFGGGNSAYSKRLFDRIGGFHPDLSPVGRKRRASADIFLNLELERAGVPMYYTHAASVEHVTPAVRLTRRYIWRRTYWSGVSKAVAESVLGGDPGSPPAGSPGQLARALWSALVSTEPSRTTEGRGVAYGLGYLRTRVGVRLARLLDRPLFVPRELGG
jgi:glucosyl-dolichyl phosphate glucuronosyltransferase